MSELKELIAELDFEQWLDTEGIVYRRGTVSERGREVNIKECPVCGSANWKVYFNVTNGVGKCFAGDHPEEIQFNKLVFLKYYSGKSWQRLEEYVQNALLDQGWTPKKEDIALTSSVVLESKVSLPRHYELPVDGRVPDYLVERQISPELAKYFDLRYCVEGNHAYVDPYTDQVKGQSFDMRILIPVYDLNGVMKTFQGRDITGTAERRYLFPAQLPASGKFLYNGHNAIGKRTVVVCEGAFDVMGVKRAIFDEETLRDFVEPIGTFGMHLSGSTTQGEEDQLGAFLTLKARGLHNVIMMWDSEKQAIRNTMAAARRLTSIGLNVKIACLGKEGLDPGEASPEQIITAYYRAKPYTRQLELQSKVLGIKALS
ncbi:TPA: DNA primase [Escherichia coli]|nr:DNA primase [Escherichia coli]HAX2344557.1 DNA primase [Escherichia coli]HBN7236983.1 DNA primase [Escherichia coli]HBN7444805.1 DNA primase [Escherichia coli]HBQ4879957.1 DNA primase [Escherichia coli]